MKPLTFSDRRLILFIVGFVFTILLLVVSVNVVESGVDCTTVCYVSPDGDDSNGGASPDNALFTIQEGVG